MAQDYNRLLRPGWDKKGADALARELFNILNTAPSTQVIPSTNGFYIRFDESGSGNDYSVQLRSGGVGWAFGTVVSGGGTTYRVRLSTTSTATGNTSSTGTIVTATVPRILDTESQTIPEDAKVVLVKLSDGSYKLVGAVWFTSSS